MLEMGELITKSIAIYDISPFPITLKDQLYDIIDKYIFYDGILKKTLLSSSSINELNNAFEKIRAEHADFFELSSSNKKANGYKCNIQLRDRD